MKSYRSCYAPVERLVAPLAGAWIEMVLERNAYELFTVAPLAGAWIEMSIELECNR